MTEDRKTLFEIMRNDLSVMNEHGDDEDSLYMELATADNDQIEAYKAIFMD